MAIIRIVGLTGLAAGAALLACAGVAAVSAAERSGPAYTADGKLIFPKDYRSWPWLSSGFDMSYVAGAPSDMHMFDNVFVNPEAYAAFQATGTWPDKTVMVLEVRKAEQNGSINKSGRFQTARMGAEIHIKDTARFKGGWAFFGFNGDGAGQLAPPTAACYACHAQHAAVDTTFVQFYPTLLPIAQAKGTLSPAYTAEEAARAKIPVSNH